MTLLETLSDRQLLVVTGKGGVGKSTFSAVLGRMMAERGRGMLLLELDPRESLHQLCGTAPSGGEIVEVGPRMWLQNLQPERVVEQIVRAQLRLDLIADRVVSSEIYRHFVAGAPGLKEMAVLHHAVSTVSHPPETGAARKIDQIVLDAPATGHGVSLLEAPLLVSEIIRDGPFGRMSGEIAGFVADATRCAVIAVTVAEEMPVQELIDLDVALRARFGRGPQLAIVNGLYPALEAAAPDDEPTPEELALDELWRRRRAVNESELATLKGSWNSPLVELPLLPLEGGPQLLGVLQDQLSAALERVVV
ncbi:MAG: AAA family ATPase [Acidobacteriota bacterium]|nr:MAG: AAA family ATPase [Acidobacteriota bacterium]